MTSDFARGKPIGRIRKVKWSWRETAPQQYAGELSFVLTERYDPHEVDVFCTASVAIEMTNAHPRALWPATVLYATGLPVVDEKIRPDIDALQGFPLRISVTMTRRYEGGPPMTHTYGTTVTDIRAVPDAAIATCKRPASYREQAPVYGVP